MGLTVEQRWGKLTPAAVFIDKEPRDKGEPPKLGCSLEWVGPPIFFVPECLGVNTKSVVKVWNSSGGPRPRGERACQEAVGVVHEVGDNRVDDVLRKACGRERTCFRGGNHVVDFLRNCGGKGRVSLVGDPLRGQVRTCVRAVTQKQDFLNSGQASVPDVLGELFNRCSGKQQVAVVKQ